MTNTDSGADNRHSGIFPEKCNQLGTAAGDEQVNIIVHLEQVAHQAAVGIINELHCTFGHSGPGNGSLHQPGQGKVGVDSFLAAAENNGVAGLQAENRDINGDVGSAFVHGTDNAQGGPLPANEQSVGQGTHVEYLTDRVG